MSFITSIGTAVPANRFSQAEICDFMERAMQTDAISARKLRAVFRASGITHRHSVLNDYGRQSDFSFYPNTKDFEPFPSTARRMEEYQRHALALSTVAIKNCLASRSTITPAEITHLITVSCTGMYAPGLDIDIVKALGFQKQVQRTCINFMGCYAAFNALKLADVICSAMPRAKVLIVCTELCSLHFQKKVSDDAILSNAIFGDGSAAALIESKKGKGWNLSPTVFYNTLSFTEQQHMAWGIGDVGFEMKLSAYVPDIIESEIREVTTAMFADFGKSISDVQYMAIHPGGKKILEATEAALGITRTQSKASHEVLRQFGNMSSATILFVLDSIMKGAEPSQQGSDVLSFAFGPGLTIESSLFKLTHSADA
jgi:predicted naringenin-chalcone synthase